MVTGSRSVLAKAKAMAKAMAMAKDSSTVTG
jgi:hypothetical protein